LAKVVEALLKACKNGNFDLANKEANNFIAKGYSTSQMPTRVLILHVSISLGLFHQDFHYIIVLRFSLFFLVI